MRFKTLSLIGTAALLAAPLTTARAQYNIGTANDACGGSLFTFCVSIAGAQGTGANAANFFITVMNQALHGSNADPYTGLSITALGLNGYATAPLIFAASIGTVFTTSNNIAELSNFPGTWVGGVSVPPPVANGLLFQEFITFEFLNTTAATFHTSDLAIHAQAGPGGCSSKMEINLSGGTLPPNGSNFISPDCGGVTSTPEPASVVLLATGLLGVFGFARLRRQS